MYIRKLRKKKTILIGIERTGIELLVSCDQYNTNVVNKLLVSKQARIYMDKPLNRLRSITVYNVNMNGKTAYTNRTCDNKNRRYTTINNADLYHIDLELEKIVKTIEFKYHTKDTLYPISKLEMLHDNLYYNNSELVIGSTNSKHLEYLETHVDIINNSDRQELIKEEFLNEENIEYIQSRYEKRFIKMFHGQYKKAHFVNVWKTNTDENLDNIVSLEKINNTKDLRKAVLNTDSFKNFIERQIKKDMQEVRSNNYRNISEDILLKLDNRTRCAEFKFNFNKPIRVLDLRKVEYRTDIEKPLRVDLKVTRMLKNYVKLSNIKKVTKRHYSSSVKVTKNNIRQSSIFQSTLYSIYINAFVSEIQKMYLQTPLYFIIISQTEYNIISKEKIVLGVSEYGRVYNKKLYYILSTQPIKHSKAVCMSTSSLCTVLKYMQKDKDFLIWENINSELQAKEENSRSHSLVAYELLLENRFRYNFSLKELQMEMLKNHKKKKSTLAENSRLILLQYIKSISIKIQLNFEKVITSYLSKKKYRRNKSIDLINIQSLLESTKLKTNLKSLVWYLLYLVIFLGGLKEITMQELYLKIGLCITNTFEYKYVGSNVNISVLQLEQFNIRLGNLLYEALEIALKENQVILCSKITDLQLSILESQHKYVSDKLCISNNFFKYLKVERLLDYSMVMCIKPVAITGYLNLPNIKTSTEQARRTAFKPLKPAIEVINTLQSVRYKINSKMFNYVVTHAKIFIEIEERDKPEEVIQSPDFNRHKNESLLLLEELLSNKEVTTNNLIESLYQTVIIQVSKLKIVDSSKLSRKIKTNINNSLLSTDYPYRVTLRDIKTKIYQICKKQIHEYKILLYQYSKYMEYKYKMQSIKAKVRKIKDTILTLRMWSEEYITFDNKQSIYFVWRIDHRGRLYPIGNFNMMNSKLLRYCLEPLHKYDFQYYLNDIIIDISKNYFGTNVSDIDNIKRFKLNINKWLSNKDKFIPNADNTYGFLRGLLEYESYLEDVNYQTTYLISLDGTANVYQHISCLTLDKELAKAVNMLDSIEPNDLYTDVLEKLKTESHINFNVSRNSIKNNIMCHAYGLTSHGRFKYLKEQLVTLDNDQIVLLSNNIMYILNKYYTGVVLVRKVLEELVLLKGKKGVTVKIQTDFINWEHKKCKTKKKSISYIKPFSVNKSKNRVYLLEITNDLDLNKMKTGFTANFIHSLDSESLMRTVLLYKQQTNNQPIFTIHDCFMVPAPNKAIVKDCFKDSFITIYSTDRIKKLYEMNKTPLKIQTKSKNTFKLKEIRHSKYILV